MCILGNDSQLIKYLAMFVAAGAIVMAFALVFSSLSNHKIRSAALGMLGIAAGSVAALLQRSAHSALSSTLWALAVVLLGISILLRWVFRNNQ